MFDLSEQCETSRIQVNFSYSIVPYGHYSIRITLGPQPEKNNRDIKEKKEYYLPVTTYLPYPLISTTDLQL